MPSSTVTTIETVEFEATVVWPTSGLTLGVRLIQSGVTIIARSTAAISEYPSGSGVYHATGLNTPIYDGVYTVVWDDGSTFRTQSLTFACDEIRYEEHADLSVSMPALEAWARKKSPGLESTPFASPAMWK